MFVYMRKVSRVLWLLETESEMLGAFTTVEEVCGALEKMGADPDEVDAAIMQMVAHQHNRAKFDAKTGDFISTDVNKAGQIGAA